MRQVSQHDVQHRELRWRHRLQTALYLLGIASLLALLGYALLGGTGLLWGLVFWGLLLGFAPRLSPQWLLRWQQMRPLEAWEAPAIHAMIDELATKASLPVKPILYYAPRAQMNAFAMGDKQQPILGITAGLVETLHTRELRAVLAHEISHIQHNDMWLMGLTQQMARLVSGLSFVGLLLLFLQFPLFLFQMQHFPFLLALLLWFAPSLVHRLTMAVSRSREWDADLGAAQLTQEPRALASALHKLERLQQPSWLARIWGVPRTPQDHWLHSHPSTEARIEQLLKLDDVLRHEAVQHDRHVGRRRPSPLATPQRRRGYATVLRSPSFYR